MAHVIFYEKPGCANNARQKLLLTAAGHDLEIRNLLTEAWTGERLQAFFGVTPVALWFNRAAPRVKSGEIDPAGVDAATALALMLADPILIRRPLIETQGRKVMGFDAALIEDWIGLGDPKARGIDLESCRRRATDAANAR
ncbi:MAG: ArsC/Spx/MgsR family protein [Methylovirgula sp.]